MAAKKKAPRARNPVVKDNPLLRKGGPHAKSKKAERAEVKRKLREEPDG